MPVKVVFVCLPDPGHLQVPVAIGKVLLFRDPKNEVYFVVDEPNESKIKGIRLILSVLTIFVVSHNL